MEVMSDVAFIANPLANPMEMFAQWHDEAKQYSDPHLFMDLMNIANRDE